MTTCRLASKTASQAGAGPAAPTSATMRLSSMTRLRSAPSARTAIGSFSQILIHRPRHAGSLGCRISPLRHFDQMSLHGYGREARAVAVGKTARNAGNAKVRAAVEEEWNRIASAPGRVDDAMHRGPVEVV